jgi:hexosaminidase
MNRELFVKESPVMPVRGVHLDLKGFPPTFERLMTLLEVFAAARYNALLIEWEDMFPWTVDERFRCETAYTQQQVKTFCRQAVEMGFELVPLVQCLGHVETPLRLPDYAHMREMPHRADVLNPLAKGARDLIGSMVEDVLALMPALRYFHLGGDEAWSFGTHPDTKAYIEAHGAGALYMHHVGPLLDNLLERGIRPLLWHDMMIHWDDDRLDALSEKCDLLVWGYHEDPRKTKRHFGLEHIRRFAAHNMRMWAGTAYKCGRGRDPDLPILANRIANALAWTEVSEQLGFQGVFATAWSRSTTQTVQYEPIDASLDALFAVGSVLHDGQAPGDPDAAAHRALEAAGELLRFQSCHDSLSKIADLRMRGWEMVRQIRQHLTMIGLDPRRQPGVVAQDTRSLGEVVSRLEEAAGEVRQAFAGLIDSLWVERYLAGRIEPLVEELRAVAPRVKEADPEGYGAEIGAGG